MMKKKIIYIGNMPEPYGGVTIKNKLIFDRINNKIGIDELIQKRDFTNLKSLRLLLEKNMFIIGLSGARGTSRMFSMLLSIVNKRSMKQSIYMMMGGTEARIIANNFVYRSVYQNYKKIYVETAAMQKIMLDAGLNNVDVYPNSRVTPSKLSCEKFEKFSCLFMSSISKNKGADIVIEAAKEIQSVDFHFYGHIEKSYEQEFLGHVSNLKNVVYKGIYKNNPLESEVCFTISKYNVHLFPSRWKNEGVPGILVETMLAGVPSIVSDVSYNSEIIKNGKNGIVLRENCSSELVKEILKIERNSEFETILSEESFKYSEFYNVEKHMDRIIGEITNED